MKIGIIGGTGDIGEGMSRRLSPLHEVVLGSRDAEKAFVTSKCTIDLLTERGISCSCTGVCNQDAISGVDVIILAVPFAHLENTLRGLTGFEGKIVVSPVNPMEKRDYFSFVPPPEGSAALLVKKLFRGPGSSRPSTPLLRTAGKQSMKRSKSQYRFPATTRRLKKLL